jgi:adenosylcobalamin phosphodiesterase
MPISMKRRYPFRLATTSFIHPADYADNVRRLAPLLDEIELLFLESRHLPGRNQISELRELAGALDITYNIHLPMDISLADPSATVRSQSRDAVLRALEQTASLMATCSTLHVTYQEPDTHPDTVLAWQQLAIGSLTRLLARMPGLAGPVCVETLDFPPDWLAPMVSQLDLPVCVDVGHIIRFGFDLQDTLDLFSGHIGQFHLHGATIGRDHRALNDLSAESRSRVASVLKSFHGSVCLEVFSYQDLVDSMTCLAEMLAHDPGSTG